MSCSCGFGCQPGCGCLRIVLPDNPVAIYDMVNINTLGIGVYDSTDGTTFQMRGIYSANAALTVTLDAGNNAILLTLDTGSIIDDLPQATTTQRGVGETATDAEAIAKASITTFLTPSNLAALGSSTTFAGLVELATNAETQAGLSATLAVTPAGLASLTATQRFTTTWADAVARAAATPDFAGQIGVQLDSDIMWLSRGTAAGDFNLPVFVLGNNLNISPASQTLWSLNGQDWILTGGDFNFSDGAFIVGSVTPTDFNLGAAAVLQIAGSDLNNRELIGTDAGGGANPEAYPVSQFLSTYNPSVGWGTPTGTLTRTTFASYTGQTISNPPTQAEVQAIDDYLVVLSRRVAALVTDILNINLPQP